VAQFASFVVCRCLCMSSAEGVHASRQRLKLERPRVIDMSANSLPAAVGALLAAGVGYFAISSMTSSTPALAREPTKKLVRRHSSGDHAFLPNQANKDAIKASKENFGVPKDLVHDREGDRLPTTRGY